MTAVFPDAELRVLDAVTFVVTVPDYLATHDGLNYMKEHGCYTVQFSEGMAHFMCRDYLDYICMTDGEHTDHVLSDICWDLGNLYLAPRGTSMALITNYRLWDKYMPR